MNYLGRARKCASPGCRDKGKKVDDKIASGSQNQIWSEASELSEVNVSSTIWRSILTKRCVSAGSKDTHAPFVLGGSEVEVVDQFVYL